MKKIFYLVLSLFLITSCQNSDISQINESSEAEHHKDVRQCYAISPDSALANLYNFMESSEISSRGSSVKIVSSITPISCNRIISRSDTSGISGENLLYIANFEDEQGYAILAADERIPEKVIAITDQGSLSDTAVYSAMDLVNSERMILEDYPTTGPGFFTLPEYGDEVFMNPNTVNLYDATENDTLVGNFSLDDIGAEDEMGNLITEDSNGPSDPEIISSSLCIAYAMNGINDFDNTPVHYENAKDDYTLIEEGPDSSTGDSFIKTESDWITTKSTPNILFNYRFWDQSSPFNDFYPKRRKYLIFGRRRKAPAGRFPIAIAKILTHFKHPGIYSYNGYTVNWNGLDPYVSDDNSAAALLRGISEGCGSWYFYAGTFTFPHKATSYMRFLGLSNAHSHSYSFERVTSMIDAGKPLLIYSIPGINVFKSHCWNIDGYKIKEKTITTQKYNGGNLISSTEQKQICKMVHCDFGWRGKSNGYYVSGVFKLNDSRVEHDPGTSYGGKTHYNNLLKVITY